MSDQNLTAFRNALVAEVRLHPSKVRYFIGPGGSNVNWLEGKTGSHFHCKGGRNGEFMVYAKDRESLSNALTAIEQYK